MIDHSKGAIELTSNDWIVYGKCELSKKTGWCLLSERSSGDSLILIDLINEKLKEFQDAKIVSKDN